MALRIILMALGAFAMVSGLLKGRVRVQTLVGGVGLGVLEVLAGIVLVVANGPSLAGEVLRIWIGWATAAVVVVSNLYTLSRVGRVTKGREDSEGHRLYTQLKFQQAMDDAAGKEEDVREPAPDVLEPDQDPPGPDEDPRGL